MTDPVSGVIAAAMGLEDDPLAVPKAQLNLKQRDLAEAVRDRDSAKQRILFLTKEIKALEKQIGKKT